MQARASRLLLRQPGGKRVVHAETQPGAGATAWTPAGPLQTTTVAFGAVTGRVTSVAVDPADASGNTLFLGTTGGGVWKSTNAAGAASQVAFAPVTDDAAASGTGISSLSIGAVTVQPGGTGVVLAGTGDPNDALDSYFGSGILRSTDHGATWTTIPASSDDLYGPGMSHSFYGEGFSGFAWSTKTTGLVVAAVTQAYDSAVENALQPNSVEGLYYSTDAGATWQLATIEDTASQVVQSATSSFSGYDGNAATAVVWNPVRQMFFAAVRYHGYYTSTDGATWTRLANQPGANLSPTLCPTRTGSAGSAACPIFRGALAVQPVTGDTFAITVDSNLADQGIWRDVCAASGNACSTGTTVAFGTRIADTPIQDGSGGIELGDYNLWIDAVPASADTLLYVGTQDVFKCSLSAGCTWRNTTQVNTCQAAKVAPFQHAVATGPAGLLMWFGNDGGLWRTADGVNQQQPTCSADDAAHFTNLNGALGSLGEVMSVAQSPGSDNTLLAATGTNGMAATTTAQGAWTQVLDGWSGSGAIDPVNPQNWYASSGTGVSINFCGSGGACTPASFPATPLVGDAQTASDGAGLSAPAVWMLDPQDATTMIVGTCRVWRGSVAGGAAHWNASNALSGMLDGDNQPQCSGNAQIQSLGASGTVTVNGVNQAEVLYAGMAGTLTGGELAAGHVYTATAGAAQSGPLAWTDLYPSPVLNDSSNRGQFNPGGFGISAVVADSHDPTGQTVYTAVQGFSGNTVSAPKVYRSTNQGQSWTNITANLPDTPVNAVVVDPNNANMVYLATDTGVYMTTNVASCSTGPEQCWSVFGTGLPDAPVTSLVTDGPANSNLLLAGTYGRGVWEMPLASAPAGGSGGGGSGTTSMQLSPTSLTFGTVALGSASGTQTVTVTNTGSAALVISAVEVAGDFTEQDNCSGSIAAGAACAVQVAFAPTLQGPGSGLLTVLGNVSGGQATAMLAGTGGAPGQVVLSPLRLVFPGTAVGVASPVQYITVSNTGGSAVTLQTPTVTGDFSIQGNSCTASEPAQTSCTVGVVLKPSKSGTETGVFTVATGAGSESAQLTGQGLAPATDTLSTTTLNFATQTVGSASTPQTVTVTNSGDQPLTLVSAASSSADFVVNAAACSTNVPGHQSCAISLVFAPQVAGVRTGSLVISDALNAGGTGQSVALNGTGAAPPGVLSLAPQTLQFGSEGVGGTTAAQPAVLTNNGGSALTGLTFAATGDFAVSPGSCGAMLAPGASCSASVTFQPIATGPRSGTLTVNGTNAPQSLTAALSGTGMSFSMSLTSASSVTIVTGSTATYQVALTPDGASSGPVTLACTGAPTGSTCALNPASLTLTGGTSSSVTVTVSTPPLPTASEVNGEPGSHGSGWMLAGVLPLFGLRRRRVTAVWLGVLLMVGALGGCGTKASGGTGGGAGGTGGGGVQGTAYTLTVTASAPGIQKTATMSLVLEQ